ncbi:phosphoesterase, DHH family protein [Lachnospiraceae bacterium KM106-2]|nr:phosphoesterase, DHH family protein [Lachnospiraceae bacterium KM106-2]
MSLYVLAYVLFTAFIYYRKRTSVLKELVQYSANYETVQNKLITEMLVPYAVLDMDGRMLWGNNEFLDVIENEKAATKNITNIFPEIHRGMFPMNELDVERHVQLGEHNYHVVLRLVRVDGCSNTILQSYGVDENVETDTLVAMYLFDETEIKQYIKINMEQRLIVGLLYIDNYEEALESIDEVRRSLLIALVDRKINKQMQSIDAIIKKLEKDKYIVIFKQKYLPQLQNTKFSLLDEVRAVNIGNDMAVTLSMGLGVNADSYLKGYEYARAAIDLALGRGGDQVVIKDGDKIQYYGGKSMQVEKNTRVKARVKAHALKELVEAKDIVVIMGHSIGDVDSFGAAIGIYRIAKTLNKRAYIVINEVTKSVRPVMERFQNNSEYESDMFLNSARAKDLVDENTLLVVVDVNRPSYTECEELLDLTKTIVILDHHRQTGEVVQNAVLSYIEPYASSSCEMVAEILQYIGEGLKLKQCEADAMYSGIMIDTNNFLSKTGVRTFEAAAFLRRSGADVTRIRKSFRSDMVEYIKRAEALSHTEVFLNNYAIAVSASEGVDSPTILGAQVANELLNITGIKASFVLTSFNNKIYISARSIDELNVQIVMEKLGGGGHMTIAGAQIENATIEEAKDLIKQTLESMIQEGEI